MSRDKYCLADAVSLSFTNVNHVTHCRQVTWRPSTETCTNEHDTFSSCQVNFAFHDRSKNAILCCAILKCLLCNLYFYECFIFRAERSLESTKWLWMHVLVVHVTRNSMPTSTSTWVWNGRSSISSLGYIVHFIVSIHFGYVDAM